MKNEQQHLESAEMKLLRELNQRTTRLESRMVQLGDHVGANLRLKMRIEVCRPGDAGCAPYVEIDALDVSISRVTTVLQDMGIDEAIDVYLKNKRVATVYPQKA
ncbi:hypothetical protein P5X00_40065 (plasmid) [Paraburkholderia sp. A2RO-4L]|uniref:hypothetical protein n=1 Tax=Paraburkholderia sp. A2RO-4L TaxID=3028374 RepID=UPI003DA86FD9